MDKQLTLVQAYQVMLEFLKAYYDRTGHRQSMGCLLGDIDVTKFGWIGDPASWHDWLDAVTKVLENKPPVPKDLLEE